MLVKSGMIKQIAKVFAFGSIFYFQKVLGFPSLTSAQVVNDDSLISLSETSIEYARARCGWAESCGEDSSVAAFGSPENNDLYYVLKSSANVYSFDLVSQNYVGPYSLNFPERVKMKGEGVHWDVRVTLQINATGEGEYISDPEAQELDLNHKYTVDTLEPVLGCYNLKPLRYGDVDGDGQQELVLFLNNDIVLFSLGLQKAIFSTGLHSADELESDVAAITFEDRDDNIYQYLAHSSTKTQINGPVAATRSFAKLFFGDVNGDNQKDIVVWRKLYESRLKSDTTQGFSKVGDLYIHYQLVSGEYKLQSTEQATIKSWLSVKNLTWQKGFPSSSECAGQEGNLIPEMHDTLLNDADVLQ